MMVHECLYVPLMEDLRNLYGRGAYLPRMGEMNVEGKTKGVRGGL